MGYKVIDSQQISQMTRSGRLTTIYRVSIQTDRGSTGDIDISEADWAPEKLGKLLAAFSDKLDLAFTLKA